MYIAHVNRAAGMYINVIITIDGHLRHWQRKLLRKLVVPLLFAQRSLHVVLRFYDIIHYACPSLSPHSLNPVNYN